MSALPAASSTCAWCAEPNHWASSEREVEDALERRRVRRDDALGLLEPGRVAERLHGGFDLVIGVGAAVGH